ncbi:hypothetical protein FOIG_05175 [Fusarium odoratissimum NRRL 54006]|uniref:Uncharacterized protein n=2 Tax=Fusarium oxysporum species complex TaxID=171631 RepID=X0L8G3_FUSO5|nr:uncharacterized protein FOIG_05175 [Fusarium odoratissimum NRRL 54006]EXM05155.1 hypothetical protein FOIG_05175 [Fusarium odoratissimum NRRL 54006]TXB99278.1 hypothetical protein FocTR4_00012888 [Fusarium oxysporum f. sp. cubense]
MDIGSGRASRRSVRKKIRLFGKLRTELSMVFERGARTRIGGKLTGSLVFGWKRLSRGSWGFKAQNHRRVGTLSGRKSNGSDHDRLDRL